ncbi:hypothetical protein CL658_01505 [bacterium]|nr:hypothetical protein [bacterium]
MFIIKRLILLITLLLFFSSLSYSQDTPDETDSTYIKTYMPDFSKSEALSNSYSLKTFVIDSITVTGNVFVSSNTILAYSSLAIGNSVSDLTLERAKKTIKRKGSFRDVTLKYDEPTKHVSITVSENPIITDIIFDGASIYTPEDLLPLMKTQRNQPVNMAHVRADIKTIQSKYKDEGYIESKIYNIKRPETNKGPLIFKIAEGVIDDIIITGNIKTQDFVILRELDIRPGDIINQRILEDNIRQIFNLNYFNNIIPDLTLTEEPHHYNLIINLDEKETSGAFTLGGGFQPNRGFNIFSDLYWDNLMGKGQLIMLKGNFGLGAVNYDNRSNTYQFKYHNPWAFGKRKSFTLRVWSSSGNFQSFNLLNQQYRFKNSFRRGIDTEYGFPHTYDFRTSHKTKYESIRIIDDNIHYYLYTYTFRATYDKRDQKLNPTTGYFANFSIEQGFKFRNSAIDLTRIDLVFQKLFSVFNKQVLFFQSKFGFIRSPQINNESIFVDEYYYVGGSHTVRGYHDNEPFGYGDKQIIGTVEYRYVFSPTVTAYLFSDVGYASKIKNNDNVFIPASFTDISNYKVTKGIGVTFVINPIGPIQLHYGITQENPEGRVQFNLGYSF